MLATFNIFGLIIAALIILFIVLLLTFIPVALWISALA